MQRACRQRACRQRACGDFARRSCCGDVPLPLPAPAPAAVEGQLSSGSSSTSPSSSSRSQIYRRQLLEYYWSITRRHGVVKESRSRAAMISMASACSRKSLGVIANGNFVDCSLARCSSRQGGLLVDDTHSHGGTRSTAARSTAARSTAARFTAASSTAPARSTAARSRAALLQTEGVLELIHRATLLSPSSLDATVIPAASSDFCVPSGGRLLCTSRRIYFRVASPAVTSVGIFSVYVHFTPRPPHPSAPGSPIHWHLSKTNPTGSPVFTASHMMIRGLGFARESFTLVLVHNRCPKCANGVGRCARGEHGGEIHSVRLFN